MLAGDSGRKFILRTLHLVYFRGKASEDRYINSIAYHSMAGNCHPHQKSNCEYHRDVDLICINKSEQSIPVKSVTRFDV